MDSGTITPAVLVEELDTLDAFFVRRRLEVVKRLNAAYARISKARRPVGQVKLEQYTPKGNVSGYSGQRCGGAD